MEQQFAQMAEQQLASERKKIASLNLFPEEERKKIVNKILILTEPLLIDENNNVRIEGREIISDLSKAVGLATMIDVMCPNCDCIDEYVRNTAAQSFSVVASALGIPAMLPFLEEVCHSEKSWQAPHTGIMIVHHIAILIRSAALLVGSIAISTTFGVFDGNY